MNRYALLFFAFLSLLMTSCKDKNAVTLKEKTTVGIHKV